jgi:hypothetical protein
MGDTCDCVQVSELGLFLSTVTCDRDKDFEFYA